MGHFCGHDFGQGGMRHNVKLSEKGSLYEPLHGFRKQRQKSHMGESEEMTDAPAGKSGFPVGTVVAVENQKCSEIPGIPELS